MPVVKATVLSTRRFLLVQTDGGRRLKSKLIPHIKIGDPVWVFLNKHGSMLKIEPHMCQHGEAPPLGAERHREELPNVNYHDLDSVE